MENKLPILKGIRVLDFTKAIAGPLAGAYLADMGAEVIKIEPVGGDPSRARSPKVGQFGGYFTNCNRGKKSFAIDMKSPEVKRPLRSSLRQPTCCLKTIGPASWTD